MKTNCCRMFATLILALLPLSLHAARALDALSVRLRIDPGAITYSSFTVEGTVPKTILIRAVGPTLGTFGPGALSDPLLTVYNGSGLRVAENDNWVSTTALSAAVASVGAIPLSAGSKDAALLMTASPGTYTIAVSGVANTTGLVILEVYATDTAPRLAYLSVRTVVPTPFPLGFVINGTAPQTVLIRVLGPALATLGVSGALVDPSFEITKPNPRSLGFVVVGTNDNWGGTTALSNAAATAGLMPLENGSKDAALLLTLTPDFYRIEITGVGNTTGLVLVEVAIVDADRPSSFTPALTSPLQNQIAAVGSSVTFGASYIAKPAAVAFQWRKNGTPIAGATAAALILPNVQTADVGDYSVAMTNSAGTTTTAAATLTVGGPPIAPTITTAPLSQTTVPGAAVTFSVVSTGAPAPTYQWRKDGIAIAGATNATLTLANTRPSDAGTYTVVVTNAAGSVTSNAGTLSLGASRLINLSILTSVAAPGDTFTMGYVVGPSGTTGSKPLVIRAAGPSLGALGVGGTLDDPKIELFAGSTKTGENDNWGGSATVANAMAAVGAFAYSGPTSRDATSALSVASGDNSVKVSAVGSGTGAVIAEIYDATPAESFTSSTPRLLNVSVLKPLGAGFTVGFVVGGNISKNVLVRAIGPTLGTAFLLGGVVSDPQLTLFSGQTVIGANDNWGGGATLTSAFASVGAFVLPPASRDAAVTAALSPGNYTVQVSGVGGATGTILVEIYELP